MAGKPDDLIAFIDESKRPIRNRRTGKADTTQWHYVLAAVVIMRTDLDNVRRKILQIEADLNYELHYHEMKSHTRRRNAIDAIGEITEWESYITETNKPIKPGADYEHGARASQLRSCFSYLHSLEIKNLVLETRAMPNGNQTLDAKDASVLEKLRHQTDIDNNFRLDHVTKNETILKIADLLASSRTDMLCAKDESIYPRIGHRATIIKSE